jgi:hypothetical protein
MALHEQCTGATDEWYTPPHVFDALGCSFDSGAKKVLGWVARDMARFYRTPEGQLVTALDVLCWEWEERGRPSLDLD